MKLKFENNIKINHNRPKSDLTIGEGEKYFQFFKKSWNDKFRYKTLYEVTYFDKSNEIEKYIGLVKIGYGGIGDVKENDYRTIVNDGVYLALDDMSFSLGQSAEYYQSIIELGTEISDDYFKIVKDVAFDLEIFKKYKYEKIMVYSLLRDVSSSTVSNQFHRIAHGGVEVSEYYFEFSYKGALENIRFEVDPTTVPQTNSHVIIGRNGAGKSYLLDRMLRSAILDDTKVDHCNYQFLNEEGMRSNPFAGVTLVSFSVFDDFVDYSKINKNEDIIFNYIGVKCIDKGEIKTKTLNELAEDFYKSLQLIYSKNIVKRWEDVISHLSSDHIFDTEIKIIERMKEYWEGIESGDESVKEYRSLDHFLPKSLYPSLSITDINLLPSCTDCNKDKLNSDDIYINYYFEDIDDKCYLSCHPIFKEKDVIFDYRLDKPSTWDNDKFQRLSNQFNKTNLLKYYAEQAQIEFSRKQRSFIRLAHQPSSLENELKDLVSDEESVLGINSLQSALWRGLVLNVKELNIFLLKQELG